MEGRAFAGSHLDCDDGRVGVSWYAVALLTGPLVMGVTVFVLSLVSPEFRPDFLTAEDRLSMVVTGIVVGLMVGSFEELGWTGFAMPRLRLRYGVVTTGLVMGLLWGGVALPDVCGDYGSHGHPAGCSCRRDSFVRVAASVPGAHGVGL